MKKTILIALALASTVSLAATGASAQGFIGGLIDQVVPGLGTTLDQANAALGNPVDHAGAAILEAYVPGAGQALEGAWAIQRGQYGAPAPGGYQQPQAPSYGGGYTNAGYSNRGRGAGGGYNGGAYNGGLLMGAMCGTLYGNTPAGFVAPVGQTCFVNGVQGIIMQ